MENLTKVCTKCKIKKSVDSYRKRNVSKDGINSICRNCENENLKDYRQKNKEKVKLWAKKGYEKDENREEKRKICYQKYKEKYKAYSKKYRIENKEKLIESNLNWIKNNPEKYFYSYTNYRNSNKEKIKIAKKEWDEKLTDSGIKLRLKSEGFPQEVINNPKFIEVKRLIIKTKRLCKTKLSS